MKELNIQQNISMKFSLVVIWFVSFMEKKPVILTKLKFLKKILKSFNRCSALNEALVVLCSECEQSHVFCEFTHIY